MTNPSSPHNRAEAALVIIVATFLALGTLYAWQTPRWQTPDEPAHFNYVLYVAQENRLPVLQAGDYPHQYLEEIKAARFPDWMSVSSLRYESHQPPLYYVLTALLYRATSGLSFDLRFLFLRLFSVVLGALSLLTLYHLVREVFPETESVPLMATGLVATIPMHLAMTAAVNNDALAAALLALLFWQSARAIRHGVERRRALILGVLLGLILLTKTTIYLVAGGTVITTVLLGSKTRRVGHLGTILALAFLLAMPFFARNAYLYGNLDILGWQRHDSIVVGQLRTADLIRQIGLPAFVQRFVSTTFHSFWAQFGWMGVPVDDRIYLALAILTVLVGVGICLFLVGVRRGRHCLTREQQSTLLVLAVASLLTLVTYVGYNFKFVQHQGRYLFPALVPVGLAAALGVRELVQPRPARLLAAILAAIALLLCVYGILNGDVAGWSVLLLLAAGGFLMGAACLPARLRWLPFGVLYLGLVALDYVCLVFYLVPALRG